MLQQAKLPDLPEISGITFRWLRDLGMAEAVFGVDTQNLSGALRHYESMGSNKVKRWTDYRSPLEV